MSILNYNKGRSGFGLTALNKARAAGLSDQQIQRQAAQAGLQLGPAASLSLGANPTMHAFAQPGSYGFGASAVQRAQAAGMTNAQIRSNLADSGLTIGEEAAKILNVNAGRTYAGYAPGVQNQTSYAGNSGGMYPLRPQLAPRGYGLGIGYEGKDPNAIPGYASAKLGFSPTFYIAGGSSDYEVINQLYGLDYQGGPDIGGGYRDPDFHRVNYVPPASDPGRPFGGYPGGINPNQMTSDFNKMIADNQALLEQQLSAGSTTSTTVPQMNYTVPGDAKVSGVNSAGSGRTKSTTTSFTRKKDTASDLQIKSVNI